MSFQQRLLLLLKEISMDANRVSVLSALDGIFTRLFPLCDVFELRFVSHRLWAPPSGNRKW